jgi:hypothetical protein
MITEQALAKGDAVIASARDPQTVIDQIGEHPTLRAAALDAIDEAQAYAAARIDRFGRIDTLVGLNPFSIGE